jgi:hypothetical protein
LYELKIQKSLRLCFGFAALLLISHVVFAADVPPTVLLQGIILDEDGKLVDGVEVKIQQPSGQIKLALTDAAGFFEFSLETAGEYFVSLNKAGFFRMAAEKIELKNGNNTVSLGINHETEIHEQIEIYSSTNSINPMATSHQDSLIAREIRDIPVQSTHDLRNSLEVLPEVVSDLSGQLHIAGGRTDETQYLLDGFDIGDPITGDLTARINVDSVRIAEVESSRFGAQYGNAGAGVLALNTIVGDDKWRASATNFVPGFSADPGIHFSSWYPRFTLSGPLHKERAWISESLSVQRTVSRIHDLPRHANTVAQWAGDNMIRTQIKLSPRNMLQGNFLYNQRNASNLGLGPLSPVSTTRGLQAYRSFLSVKDQIWSGRTFFEMGLAGDIGHDETLPYGIESYFVTPSGSGGNYFESLKRQTRRWQGFANVTLPTRRWLGAHDLQFGLSATAKGWTQSSLRKGIHIRRFDGTIAQQTVFSGQPNFHLSDTFTGAYVQDTWRITRALILQVALRADWDRLMQQAAPSPRISVNILPFHSEKTKFTGAWGVYLQPFELSSIGPAYDQQRLDSFYNQAGDSPVSSITSRFALPHDRLKQSRFQTISAGWEQAITDNSQIRFSFTQRNERFGLAYEKEAVAPDLNIFLLRNNRQDSYRSSQISFRHAFSDKTALTWNFTRSSARTNQVFDYSLESLMFSPQAPGPLSWDAPNRFVSSGWTPAPFGNLFLSYFFEYRSGFPFSQLNERQLLAGPANGARFPDYASLNLGIEKHIRFLSRIWAVRLTILNINNHFNPDSVINNIDSPNFMKYGGGQKRAFNARVRLIG